MCDIEPAIKSRNIYDTDEKMTTDRKSHIHTVISAVIIKHNPNAGLKNEHTNKQSNVQIFRTNRQIRKNTIMIPPKFELNRKKLYRQNKNCIIIQQLCNIW